MTKLIVDGKEIDVPAEYTLLQACEAAGAEIPRFCYHERLSIAGNCRMCLVEEKGGPKPVASCAWGVRDCRPGPKGEPPEISTRSPMVKKAREGVMEFLLINHPLDCPICDQGGECELQDLAVGFGRDISRFVERKRSVKDKNLGPLVSTDMTRCIHCTRCVRFGQDIAGIQEMGATGRGENMEIGTFIEHSVDHELSGNIIDLCPVGALNSKPFRYRGRGWEMTQVPLICPHDGVGTQLYGHVLRGRLMRVVPRPCEEINETWIADRDRFSYEGVYSEDRLLVPRLRGADGSWQEVEWDVALNAAAEGLKAAAGQAGGVGLLAHPSSTLEELYLLARLADGLGSASIDHRLRQRDFRDQGADEATPGVGLAIADIDKLDALLVIGSNLRHEVPILAHRVRKASLRGARISFINPVDFDYFFTVAHRLLSAPASQVADLAAVLLAALDGAAAAPELGGLLAGVAPTDEHRAIAEK